jgi:hypothetical protein
MPAGIDEETEANAQFVLLSSMVGDEALTARNSTRCWRKHARWPTGGWQNERESDTDIC